MRTMVLGAMIAGAMIGSVSAQDRPHGRLFVSPMGEPFRAGPDGAAPEDQWFDGADANYDGVLTLAEMTADAARFFALLDVRKDGEIDPDDITRYETELFPEISGSGPGMGSERPHGRLKGDGSGLRTDNGFGSPRSDASNARESVRKGAARFGYLDYPQPIVVADRNFNRGVDPREWAKAAEIRFNALDSNGDGKIPKSELPELPQGRGW